MNMVYMSGISVCIWDFDGTLFRAESAFHDLILEADYRVVMEHRGWSREKTVAEFHKIYKVKTPSSTQAAARLSGIPLTQAAIECEHYKDRLPFLSRDEKLIKLFQALSGYTHYMLANGIREKIIPSLYKLGVPQETFAEIVTSEVAGVNKPQPGGFRYIMTKTGLPAKQHLMIGDREAVDLAPAKALGMKTCLISWGVTKPETDCVDDMVSDVYSLEHLLL